MGLKTARANGSHPPIAPVAKECHPYRTAQKLHIYGGAQLLNTAGRESRRPSCRASLRGYRGPRRLFHFKMAQKGMQHHAPCWPCDQHGDAGPQTPAHKRQLRPAPTPTAPFSATCTHVSLLVLSALRPYLIRSRRRSSDHHRPGLCHHDRPPVSTRGRPIPHHL